MQVLRSERPRHDPLHLSIDSAPRTSIGSRRNPQSTRAILAAAVTVLRQHGVVGFSIDAVARRARCGKPTIYRWWPDKLALLLDLHDAERAATPPDESCDLRAYWEASPAGLTLRAAAAEALGDAAALQRLRQRVNAAYADVESSMLRALLGEWLLGGDASEPPVAVMPIAQTIAPPSVRHRGEWVD